MNTFVRMTAPTGKLDFLFKLSVFLVLCGGLNHVRDLLTSGPLDHKTFIENFSDATFTALPMCTFALFLIGHLNTLQKRLYHQATRDLLTGLHNRRWFIDNTPRHIAPEHALLIVDVDHFKQVNDTFGHDVGDQCLIEVAKHLRAAVRQTDDCARIGGEEFAIFLHSIDAECVHDIATRISAGFVFEVGDGNIRQITASVGVAVDQNGQSRGQAFLSADKAVSAAKEQGRARYILAPARHDYDAPTPLAALA